MSSRRQRVAESAILPSEQVLCRIDSRAGDILICTDSRVILVKRNGIFGTNSFEAAIADVTTLDVKVGILTGEIHIGTSSMMATKGLAATTRLAANIFVFSKKSEEDVRRSYLQCLSCELPPFHVQRALEGLGIESSISSVRRWLAIVQPMTLRLKASSTTVR